MPKRDYYLPTRRLVSQDDSAVIEQARIPRSRFQGTWTRKTAFDAGYLVPFLLDEVLPGDHLSYDVTAYVRLSTPLFPIMDNQRIDTFFFYVPNRILWTNWVKFMGEQASPADSIAFTIPTITLGIGDVLVSNIYDHFGIPYPGAVSPLTVNALPFRAYNKIYNAWFRDQNIVTPVTEITADTGDLNTTYTLRRRAKAHDYFTSALPWPQKFIAPAIPLGGLAPIIGLGWIPTAVTNTGPSTDVWETGKTNPVINYPSWHSGDPSNGIMIRSLNTGEPQVFADIAAASGVGVNAFRQAFLVQSLLERDARGGTRYVELIRSHFGVINPDFRLQRPEYIGGGQSPLQITPVAQTAPTTGLTVGALGAAGTAVGQHRASYAATEHGYILGLINVRTELSYQQALHRMWTRATRYDFYWPSLAGLGEQTILRQEIYATGVDLDDQLVFGYQERWHEYRTRYSDVTGIMRSTAADTLDMWHLAQKFLSPPLLNQTFIEDTPPMSRVLAAGSLATNQQYLADIMIHRTAVRPIPMFGTPATLGRF